MRWRLARAHLSNPALLILAVMGASIAAFEPAMAIPSNTAPLQSAFSVAGFWLLMTAVGVMFLLPAAATAYEHTLPLHTRVLREGKWLAACVVLGVPILTWGVSAHFLLPATPSVAAVLALLAAAAMFAMLLYFTTDTGPRLMSRASVRAEIILRAVLLLAVCAALLYMLPIAFAAVALSVLVLPLYVVLARLIPAAQPLAIPQRDAATVMPANAASKPHNRLSELLLLARTAMWWPMFGIPLLSGMSGYYGFFHSALLVMIVASTAGLGSLRLRWMSALPISHSRRFLFTHGPLIALSVLAFAVGQVIGFGDRAMRYSELTRNGQRTNTPGDWGASPTRVSMVHWLVTDSNVQPLITAPWGEAVRADTISLFGVTRYNPFTSRKSSSRQFIDWQFTRASTVVFGETLTQAQYASLSPTDRPRVITRQSRAIALGNAAFVLQLLLGVWFFELGRWHRVTKQHFAVRHLVGSLPAIYLLQMLVLRSMTNRAIYIDDYLSERFTLTLLQLTHYSWLATAALITISITAAWRVLVWQFARSDTGIV